MSRLANLLAFVILPGFVFADEPIKPVFKPSRETTFVDGPLDSKGFVDYEKALNLKLRGQTTPETNALALLVQKCFGPKPEGVMVAKEFFAELGIPTPPK